MTSQALASLLISQPFRPFAIVLSDNTEITVEKPEQVKHETRSRTVTVVHSDLCESIIDLDLVALIDVKPPKPKPWSDER